MLQLLALVYIKLMVLVTLEVLQNSTLQQKTRTRDEVCLCP